MVAMWDLPRAAEKPQVCKARASFEEPPEVKFQWPPERVWAMCNKAGNVLYAWRWPIMLLLVSLLNFVTQNSMISKVCRGGHLLYVCCEMRSTATAALVDSGATQSFISARLARKLRMKPVLKVSGSMRVEMADGSTSVSSHVFPRVKMKIGGPHGGASYLTHATLHALEDLGDEDLAVVK
jgi:hypothetical protein